MAAAPVIEELFMSSGMNTYCRIGGFTVPPLSASLHYGNAIFEGMSLIAVEHGRHNELGLFHPALNYERLHFGAEFLGYDIKRYKAERLIANIFHVCALNGWHEEISLAGGKLDLETPLGKRKRIYARPIVYSAKNSIGISAAKDYDVLQALVPMGEYLEKPRGRGLSVMVFPYSRELPFSSVKASSNYQLSDYADTKLKTEYNVKNAEKCDEVVFVNSRGNLTEGAGENLLMLRDGEVIAPPVSEGTLPGITMRIVRKIAGTMGIRFRYGTFRPEDAENADALFFTGNAAGVVPIGKVAVADENYGMAAAYETKEGMRSKTMMKIIREYDSVFAGSEKYGKFYTYIHEWMDERQLKKITALSEKWRREGTNLCAVLNTPATPPAHWEKHKKAMTAEFGINRFI